MEVYIDKSVQDCLVEYFKYLQKKDINENTLSEYKKSLYNYFSDILYKDISFVTQDYLKKILESLKIKNKPATINFKISVLRGLFEYLEIKYDAKNPMTLIKHITLTDKIPSVILEKYDVKIFLKNIKNVSHNYLRDYAMFKTFLDTGCKLSELKNLTLKNIDFENSTITFLGFKGKPRVVNIDKHLKDSIKSYCEFKFATDYTSFIFITKFNNRFTTRGIQDLFKTLSTHAGIYKEGLTISSLRDTCFINMYKDGVDLVDIKKQAGNVKLSSVEKYTKCTGHDR